VEAGKSPIVEAIGLAEVGTSGEIRVHLSRKWWEKDPMARAHKLFDKFGMSRTSQRNAVLLYVNLRKHKFAIYGDSGVHEKVGQVFWDRVLADLTQGLRSTHYEKAIAEAVVQIGAVLKTHFPVNSSQENLDELPNHVTLD
jgi:uncharacterized membrane protein